MATVELGPVQTASIRRMLRAAFGAGEEAFTEDDWSHAIGGIHVVLLDGPDIVGHASVVERVLRLDGRPVRAGYVEAVAVPKDRRGQGLGSLVMAEVGRLIGNDHELGALSTGRQTFYERLGWRRWRGHTAVRTAVDERRTPEDDGGIMVLVTPSSPAFDLAGTISCDWRPGDVW